MTRLFQFLSLILFISCKDTVDKTTSVQADNSNQIIKLYSKTVKDTFTVFVNLPDSFNLKPNAKYPVVYILDANLHFDIFKTIIKKYNEIEELPKMVLVGIGYANMNSNGKRFRDYCYPGGIVPFLDSLELGNGADKFYSFIANELSPLIDKNYQTDTTKRILFGHSLGGYFSSYALLKSLESKNEFNSFISASPSLFLFDKYLPNQFSQNIFPKRQSKLKLYISSEGNEPKDSLAEAVHHFEILKSFAENVMSKDSDKVAVKYEMLQNIQHLDTPFPSFINGLRWALNK